MIRPPAQMGFPAKNTFVDCSETFTQEVYLVRRVYQHKEKLNESFTKRYNLNKLAYYEIAETAEAAINREKQLKGGSRQDKVDLIKRMNPKWLDLYETIL